MDHLVASQREDGDFGPEHLTDWWPRMLMLRVLRQYVLATRAKEPLKLMDRFFRFQLEALPDRPLVGKSCSRAAENMLAALWLATTSRAAPPAEALPAAERPIPELDDDCIFPSIPGHRRCAPGQTCRRPGTGRGSGRDEPAGERARILLDPGGRRGRRA